MPWTLTDDDLKKYPHFDSYISAKDGFSLATNPDFVAKHTFYPFIRYIQRWNRFAKKGLTGKPKERPIRYAARRDAYILSYYRYLLAEPYEAELKRLDLDQSVLAYRKIAQAGGLGGKCNIHFAQDAFKKILATGDCWVMALDISKFFESLDHQRLKSIWCRLLDKARLPEDHFRVFETITKYAVVDKHDLYRRLGHIGPKRIKNGVVIEGYLTNYKKMPKQLCKGDAFRKKVSGGPEKSLIRKNFKPYGIPQGAPISDLLVNIYLIDFDTEISARLKDLGGTYYRYSDDILIVLPTAAHISGPDLLSEVSAQIAKHGKKLKIKADKCSLFLYERNGAGQKFKHLSGKSGASGLEYLGFRYDGHQVFLRNSTISNFQRKIAPPHSTRQSRMCDDIGERI